MLHLWRRIRVLDGSDPYVGRKLPRLLRNVGFKVEHIAASYDIISDLLKQIGPSLAAAFATSDHSNMQDKPDDSLFVALAWCEAIGIR